MTEGGGRPEAKRPQGDPGGRRREGVATSTTRPRHRARRSRARGRVAAHVAGILALALVGAGCAATATPFPVKQVAAPAAPTEPPENGPRMRIVDLEEYATEAPGWVVVVGTIENGGRSTTEELRITVNALGAGDRIVTSSPAIARSQTVRPRGSTTFAAVFAKLAEVEAYHVKVLAW